MLDASGLWPSLVEDIETGLDIGYENILRAYGTSWNDEATLGGLLAIDSRLVNVSAEGNISLNTEIVWRMNSPAKIKKMFFGKRGVDLFYRNEIAYAMEHGETYSTPRLHAGYDVTFNYDPEHKKATYSEEYKGCGNGHYYLALNGTHALFYQDD